ncbi:hypothetical protein HDU83_002439 [Entophlyctis luteolus]|nr:hypothetical protein HDU83_002439 [Entophlyctis luteolus]
MPRHSSRSFASWGIIRADPVLRSYGVRQTPQQVDLVILLNPDIAKVNKIRHLESVMLSILCSDMNSALFHHNIDSNDPWLRFHLRMLEFPRNSIQYDLDMIALYCSWPKSKNDFLSVREWNVELLFWLTLLRKQDDEICHRLSLILLKVHKATPQGVDFGEFAEIVREIQMYVKLTGVPHLENMINLLSGKLAL